MMLRVLAPLVLALTALALAVSDSPREHRGGYLPGTERTGRVVLVLVDSLSDRLAEDPKSFPALAELRERALWGRLVGCLPASTVTCARTMLEGSSAGYGAGVHNFSASRATPDSFPVQVARSGLRIAVASDHTLVNMCEGLGGPRLQYWVEKIPPYHWDEAAVVWATEWLRRDQADALLIHLVDLDKASHSGGPASATYQEQVREADRAIAAIAALLTPADSLIVVGDHGHDEFGNHTPNPGYLALGPAFTPGRVDLQQPTIALLLSVAAGTPLARSYEGEVPERGLRVPFGASSAARAQVAADVEAHRAAQHGLVRDHVWRFLPGLALALLSLVVVAVERGKRLPAVVIAAFAGVAAWALGVGWASHGRPLLWYGPLRNLFNYVGALGAFVLGGVLVLGKLTSLGRAARFGAAMLAFPLVVPLIGEDYFGSPTSLARLFAPALALIVLKELRERSAYAVASVGAGALAWVLTLVPMPNGESWLPALVSSLAGAAAIALCFERSVRKQSFVRASLLLVTLGVVMGLGARATLSLALLAVATSCFARSGGRHVAATLSLVGASAILLGYWSALQGLRFEKVRFDFALRLLPTISNEATLALVVTVLTVAKYALVPWVIIATAPTLASEKHGARMAGFLLLAVLLQAAWVSGALLDAGSRYYELGVQAACLLAALSLLSVGVLAIRMRVATWAWSRARAEVEP